jgi:hypothetical protein
MTREDAFKEAVRSLGLAITALIDEDPQLAQVYVNDAIVYVKEAGEQ